jgi:hypothetical protein
MLLQALPKACKIDSDPCTQVRHYLDRFTHNRGLTDVSVEGAATHGANPTVPDRYGMREQGCFQPSDYVLANVGVVGYEGKTDLLDRSSVWVSALRSWTSASGRIGSRH